MKTFLVILAGWVVFFSGCDSDSLTSVSVAPTPEYYGACRHAAAYAALIIQQNGVSPDEIIVDVGMVETGEMHAETRARINGRWVYLRMAYDGRYGIIADPNPVIAWKSTPTGYSVPEYMSYFAGWAVQ